MTKFAPELPTTIELEALHALGFDPAAVNLQRQHISQVLQNPTSSLVAGVGPCSFTGDPAVLHHESAELASLQANNNGLITLQRRNFWKPRTNPEDWHGPETTEPIETYRRVVHGAMAHANGTAEVATVGHIERYGKFLSLGWFGARNSDVAQQIAIAQADPMLPLGYKNSVDGKLEEAVETVQRLSEARGTGAAPIVLIYRGGSDAQTPTEWGKAVQKAMKLTGGRMILDVAHGGEQAHDPSRQFQKTKLGQAACLAHAIQLSKDGFRPAGYLMEASEIESQTDPNMPFALALEGIKLLLKTRQS